MPGMGRLKGSSASEFPVFFKFQGGKTSNIFVSGDDTVDNVRKRLADEESVSPGSLGFLFAGKKLMGLIFFDFF